MAMAMHPHFRLSLISATSEKDDVQKRIKTNLINIVKGLLNKEESNVLSSGEEVEEVAPHDGFLAFCMNVQLIANRAPPNLSMNFLQQLRNDKLIPRALHIKR